MNQIDYQTLTIGEIVTKDFRTASIFKDAGIDFCCGGKKSLDQACREKEIDPSQIKSELIKLESTPPDTTNNFDEWELDFLCDYIVNTHHKFILKTLPQLVTYTEKIASVHGEKHHELVEVADLFSKVNTELLQHLKNEEEVLFPAIKKVIATNSFELKATIITEIFRMSGEHEFAGGAMDKINEITKGYKVPADGCNTYQVTFKLLQQFEDDLHIHVHLENNILYPKALKLTY
jgi:regulator of cell morphogenesis and NO signaling